VKNVGKSSGIKIVWYVELVAQAARAQAADKKQSLGKRTIILIARLEFS